MAHVPQSPEVERQELTSFFKDLSAQANELWKHLPKDMVPDEHKNLRYKTDSKGNLMVAHDLGGQLLIFLLRDGAAWVYTGGEIDSISCYRNGDLIGTRMGSEAMHG